MRSRVGLISVVLLLTCCVAAANDDGKLHIICFGAHPDDCELQASGVGAMWAAQGHHVKFVSVTNGDESLIPKTPQQREKRVTDIRNGMANRNCATAYRFRAELATWYPPDAAQKMKYAEAFEICEYGRQPSKDELKKLFPFFDTGK